jgi:hypothetical protein
MTLAEFTAIVEASPEAVVLHYHKLHGTKRYSIDANARASKWRITFTWAKPTILTATAPQSNSGIRWHKLSSNPWLRRLATGRCRSVPLRALVGRDPARTAHFTFFRRRL